MQILPGWEACPFTCLPGPRFPLALERKGTVYTHLICVPALVSSNRCMQTNEPVSQCPPPKALLVQQVTHCWES